MTFSIEKGRMSSARNHRGPEITYSFFKLHKDGKNERHFE